MFSGVAAARVLALFKDARESAPSIVFIDEIDAIGKARTMDGFKDVGILDREQGLIQLLVEMDGFKQSERVLVIGATNRRDVLDPALLRPGRFDRTIHMGNPTVENRLKILDVHARGKQIPRGEDNAFLWEVARKAVGYSGAELANLLNEAAILQVRSFPHINSSLVRLFSCRHTPRTWGLPAQPAIRQARAARSSRNSALTRLLLLCKAFRTCSCSCTGHRGMDCHCSRSNEQVELLWLQVRYAKPEIDMDVMQEVMDKAKLGLPGVPVPLGMAKRRLAMIFAARALVGAAVGPPDHLEAVTVRSIGGTLGRALFKEPAPHIRLREETGDFSFCVGLVVPMYAARAAEEVVYGRGGTTLSTAADIATAGRLTKYLCAYSDTNPALLGNVLGLDRSTSVSQYMNMAPVRVLRLRSLCCSARVVIACCAGQFLAFMLWRTRGRPLLGACPAALADACALSWLTTRLCAVQLDEFALRIQTLAYHRALLIVHERKSALLTITEELLHNEKGTVPGSRVYELLMQPPEDVPESVRESLPFAELLPTEVRHVLYH
jgi:hypothetical protein